MAILNDDQLQIYEKHLIKKDNTNAEFMAYHMVNSYPVTLNLSEEQKDVLYQNLYQFKHSKTRSEFLERYEKLNSDYYNKDTQALIWAAEGVLSENQTRIFIQSLGRRK